VVSLDISVIIRKEMKLLLMLTTFIIVDPASHVNLLTRQQYQVVSRAISVTNHHLAPAPSLLVSLPRASHSNIVSHSLAPRSDVTDIIQVFVQALNKKSSWPLEISRPDHNIMKSAFDAFGKHRAYIFFTWSQERDYDIAGSLVEQLEEAKNSGSWNPRARFFIVVTECSRRDTRLMAQGIAETLYSEFWTMNVLILIPGTSENKDGSDMTQGMSEEISGHGVIQGMSEETDGPDNIRGTSEETHGSDVIQGVSEETDGSDTIKGMSEETDESANIRGTNEETHGSDVIQGTSEETDGSDTIRGTNEETHGSDVIQGTSEETDGSAKIPRTALKTSGLDTTLEIHLYTWIPYQSAVKCVELNVFLVDKWIPKDKGRFLKQAQLFPDKSIMNLHGCPLKVRPNLVPPVYVDQTNYTNSEGTIGYNFKGLEIEYIKFITQTLNATIIYSPPTIEDPVEARIQSLNDLGMGVIDATFGGMALHPLGLQYADPTTPYFSDTLKWYVPCGRPIPRMNKISSMFSPSVWVLMGTVILLCVAVFCTLSKRATVLGLQESPMYKQISSCLYTIWAISLNTSVPQKPRVHVNRAVFLVLVWYSFIISTVFQTFFISFIVDPGMTKQLKTSDQLLQSDYTYVYNKHFDKFVRQSIPSYYTEINLTKKECTYKLDCQTDFLSAGNIVTTGFYLYTDYYVLAALPSGSSSPRLCFLDDNIFLLHFSLYFAKGNPLTERFNYAIHRAIENGFISKITRDFKEFCRYYEWENITINYTDVQEDTGEYFVFSVSHLYMSFYFLGLGCSVAFLAFLGEMLQYKIHK
jgi:hypothetical protein